MPGGEERLVGVSAPLVKEDFCVVNICIGISHYAGS